MLAGALGSVARKATEPFAADSFALSLLAARCLLLARHALARLPVGPLWWPPALPLAAAPKIASWPLAPALNGIDNWKVSTYGNRAALSVLVCLCASEC